VAEKYKAFIESPVKLSASTRRFDVKGGPSGDLAWATIEAAISVNDSEHTSWQVSYFESFTIGGRLFLASTRHSRRARRANEIY
jgi:hypothetical protein